MGDNLAYLGRDAGWLSLELRRRGISSAKEAYLAVADRNALIFAAKKEKKA